MKTKNTLKKVAALALTFIMVFGVTSAAGLAWLPGLFGGFGISAQAASEGDLKFELIDSGTAYEVHDCFHAATGELIIPATYLGKPVTSIGIAAFSDCKNLTSVTIPDSVKSIERYAFESCTNLLTITIPDSITFVDTSAFAGTGWYSNQPDGVVYIGKVAYAYKGTMPDGTSVVIKDGTQSITEGAFRSISGLTSVTFPNSLTNIGLLAFCGCTNLTTITIPDSVTYIDGGPFAGCKKLTDITVNPTNANFSSQDGVLYNKDKTRLIQYPAGNTRTSYTIPNSVTEINWFSFNGCAMLNSVTIPDSVMTISGSAFSHSTGLISISIPDSVTRLGQYAFSNCTGLSSVTIGNSVAIIGDSAFEGCTKLSSVTIPNSMTSIGYKVFCDCTGLTSVTFPDTMTSIGESTFFGCTGLTEITIPDSVTSIGESAFEGCTGLTTVKLGSGLRSIGDSAFFGCSNISVVQYNGNESDKALILIGFGNNDLIDGAWKLAIAVGILDRIIAFIKYLFKLIFPFFGIK